MASNSHEMTQYARYEGGSLNIMLNSLQNELRAIVEEFTVNHDESRLLAVEHAEILVAIIKLLDTEFFPLFSSGASPNFVSLDSNSLASILKKLKKTIDSFGKYKAREHELKGLQNAFVMFRVFRTIQLALQANKDLKVLLDFFNKCALDGHLSPISYCKDSPNPYTFKFVGMKELCLSDVFGMVYEAADDVKLDYMKVAIEDASCNDTTKNDTELEQELNNIRDLIVSITTESCDISNDAVEGHYIDKWSAYYYRKERLVNLSSNLEDVERRFSEAEQKIFSDAGLCYRQFINSPLFDQVSIMVNVSPSNLNKSVLIINDKMNALREEILGSFTERLSEIKSTINDSMTLSDHESLISRLELLKNELTAYPHLFESDEFNNQIIDLISQRTAIVNFQQGAERLKTSVQHLNDIENELTQSHHSSVGTKTTNESLSSDSNNSLESLANEVKEGLLNNDQNLGGSVSFSGASSEDKYDAVIPKKRMSIAGLVSRISVSAKKTSEGVAQSQPKKSIFRRIFGMYGQEGTNVRGFADSKVNSVQLLADTKDHEEYDPSQNVDDTRSLAIEKVRTLRDIIDSEVKKFDLTPENMPSLGELASLYGQASDSEEISRQVAVLLEDEHVKAYLAINHEARQYLPALENTVKSHIDSEYRNCVKIKSRFDERVAAVKERIAEFVNDSANAQDLNRVLEDFSNYEYFVSGGRKVTDEINAELHELRELMTLIGEEVHISLEGMPDLRELSFNAGLAAVLKKEAEKGTKINEYVSVAILENGKQELHVVAATTRNLFQQSFIHKVNACWLDRDSAIVREIAEGEVTFQELIDPLRRDDSTKDAVQHLESMQKHLQEMDRLLGNRYNLEGTLALYLHEFISQPANSKNADNLQKVLLKCKHKLHSYDAEVAKQDKSLWDRKVTVVINMIPIIGQIVMAACYFYNKSNYGIGFFPWETTKKQDAQKKVEEVFADLEHSSSLLNASVAG